MSNFAIYSYNGARASMRYLAQYLDNAPIINRDTIPWNTIQDKILINYGASYFNPPYCWPGHWLNSPNSISNTIHKLRAFKLFKDKDIPCPEWTTNRTEASNWLKEGQIVFARDTSTGSQGHGINIIKPGKTLPYSEFYSKYLNYDTEYRVHVVKGKIITVGKKYKKESNANPFIRNMNNGWAFILNCYDVPDLVKKQGKNAVMSLGIDFGAADVAYCVDSNKAYIFEVNSAPTMSASTALNYAEAFNKLRK